MDYRAQVERILEPLRNKLRAIVSRAVVLAVQDSSKKIQLVSLRIGAEGENLSKVERVQNFGLTSNPMDGAQALVLAVGGERSHSIVVGIDDANYRIVVDRGEVAVYNAFNAVIKLCKDGTIEIGDGKALTAALDGVVTRQCKCAFTGLAHPESSTVLKVKKGS
jgi:phage baseplate assembly protein V